MQLGFFFPYFFPGPESILGSYTWVTSMEHQELGYWFKMEAEVLL